MPVDWTQVLLAAITTLGSVVSGIFAARAVRHSKRAAVSADTAVSSAEVAVQASLRPPMGDGE